MDSKPASRKANLKQYRAVIGKWQFVPVVRVNGKPRPDLVLIDGNQILTQVDVAALTDVEQLRFASGRVLALHDTEPRSEVPALAEPTLQVCRSITDLICGLLKQVAIDIVLR